MKKYICTAIFLLFIMGVAAHASELPEFPFISAKGEAEIEVAPDIATVSFIVIHFEEDATNALKVVRDRSAEIIAFFDEL